MSGKSSDLLKGLFLGGLIGAALGILFAPKSGKEMREDITLRADELLIKAKEEYEKAFEKSKKISDSKVNNLEAPETAIKGKAGPLEDKGSNIAGQGTAAVKGNKSRLKMAIEAGMEAFREEKNKRAA
jgi:gas vesicle protein